jgi:peptide/nickel transport system permease protein
VSGGVPTTLDGAARVSGRRRLTTLQAVGKLLKRPVVLLSAGWLVVAVVTSLLAGVIAPHDPLEQHLANTLALPSWTYLLGTDELGRDILSRLLYGGGSLMVVALVPVGLSFFIGVPVGLYAGYVGRWFDTASGFAVNVMFAMPAIVIVLAVAAASNNNLVVMLVVLGILGSSGVVRLVRASTQATRNLLYVDAARVAAIPSRRILLRHILPNVAGPLIVQAFIMYGGVFLFVNALAFLSLGFSPEKPSWGQMTQDASAQIAVDPWLMVPVGAVIILTVLSLNLLGAAVLSILPSTQRPSLLVPRRRASAAQPKARRPKLGAGSVETPPSEGSGDLLLALEDVSISLPGVHEDRPLVEGATLRVKRGTTVGLVGESGSGKTLTALAIIGLLPASGYLSGGSVLLEAQDLSRLSDRQLQRVRGTRIALVSQEPMMALDPCFTVRSQLAEAVRAHGRVGRGEARERVATLLRQVGIADVERVCRSYPHQLSGGMAQRVAIALALAGEPELLVADEPTTALDVTVQGEILDLLRGLQRDLGMTIVLVSHALGVVADLCDEVAVMYAGQMVEIGPVDEVLLQPGHPYTRVLLDATPDLHAESDGLCTVAGSVPPPDSWPAGCRFADRCLLAEESCCAGPVAMECLGGRQSRCIKAAGLLEHGLAHDQVCMDPEAMV